MINALFDIFKSEKRTSAKAAKERLQIVVAHQRNATKGHDYLPQMRNELISVIQKYISIDADDINVCFEHDDNCSILEMNVVLPESKLN